MRAIELSMLRTVDDARRRGQRLRVALLCASSCALPRTTSMRKMSAMSLKIGDLEIGAPAVQAALSGYSDLPMRRVARAHGAPYAINEVVIDESVLVRGKGRKRILAVPDDDHPVGGQLMGSEPAVFGQAASDLVEAGYDVLDINFGCPVGKVLGRCRGGFLLGEPDVALEIVDRVLDASAGRVPVTVKMRRGTDDSAESEERFFAILDGAFARGIDAVTVHGRSVRQKYTGRSNWDFLARVKRHLGARTMLGSGDLFSADDVRDMLDQTGVDGVTLARGCIGNPFLFGQVRDLLAGRQPRAPTIGEQRKALEMHLRESLAYWHDHRAIAKFRRHAIKYAPLHPDEITCRDAWVRVKSEAEIGRVLDEFYAEARCKLPQHAMEGGASAPARP